MTGPEFFPKPSIQRSARLNLSIQPLCAGRLAVASFTLSMNQWACKGIGSLRGSTAVEDWNFPLTLGRNTLRLAQDWQNLTIGVKASKRWSRASGNKRKVQKYGKTPMEPNWRFSDTSIFHF